jgi:hypothetical protein
VQAGGGELDLAGAGEGPEVGGTVVAYLADPGQPREGLGGELEPHRPLREARAAVVARLVLGDQAQLADLGLERGGAHDRRDHGGEADHLGHPAAGLAGGEVGADPGPQVLALADVEDLAALVDELVDPRQPRQRIPAASKPGTRLPGNPIASTSAFSNTTGSVSTHWCASKLRVSVAV